MFEALKSSIPTLSLTSKDKAQLFTILPLNYYCFSQNNRLSTKNKTFLITGIKCLIKVEKKLLNNERMALFSHLFFSFK